MKVRGKKLLAAMLSLAMVLSMFVVPASAVEQAKEWDLRGGTWDASVQVDIQNGTGTVDGLEINATSGKWGGARLGTDWVQVNTGTIIKVPVTVPNGQKAIVTINAYNANAFTVDGIANTKVQQNEEFICTGTGGQVTITATANSYLGYIAVRYAEVELQSTLTLSAESVLVKMGQTSTVTATVNNDGGKTFTITAAASDGEATVATTVGNGGAITITPKAADKTEVTVTATPNDGGEALTKKFSVRVLPAQVGTVAKDEYKFTTSEDDFYAAGLEWGSSFDWKAGNGHGPKGSNGDTLTVNLSEGKKATLTVTTCCYGGGTNVTMTANNGVNLDVTSKEVNEGGSNKGNEFTVKDAEGKVVLTFTDSVTHKEVYVHSLLVEYAVVAEDRKIDVWDFAGIASDGGENYVDNITPAKWVAASALGKNETKGTFVITKDVTFGDLTMDVEANSDRIYSTVEGNADFEAALGGKNGNFKKQCGNAYADGYESMGGWYCNGDGGENRRNATIAHVVAGDKITVYMGSSSGDMKFYFTGQGQAADQNEEIAVKSGAYNKYEFVAQHDGTYKLWTDKAGGKPVYHRVVRFPGVNVSGSITLPAEFTATDYTVKFVNQANGQVTEAVVDQTAKTYTATLAPGFTYTVALSGVTGWGFSTATRTVVTTDAESAGNKTADLEVEAKPVYTYAGTIAGFDQGYDTSKLVITLVPADPAASDSVKLTINADKIFTATLDANMAYTLEMTGANDYAITAPAEVKLTANTSGETITVEAKALFAASGKFVTLDVDDQFAPLYADSTYAPLTETVTALSFKNVDDGTTYSATVADGGYTAKLRAGAYEAVATVSGWATKTHVVVTNAAAEKDLLFVSTATPSAVAYAADIYVGDETKTPNFKTVTGAMAYIKRMTRTDDQRVTVHIAPGTYREQINIDSKNVSFVNDTLDKEVKLTWYYGIGYTYYSASGASNTESWYDAEKAFDRYNKPAMDVARWGTTVRVRAPGFRAENITFENSFNYYVTDEEIIDGVVPNGAKSITFAREKNADVTSKAATERAAAIWVDVNSGRGDMTEFFNCSFLSSQDTVGTGKRMYFKNCYMEGMTDYICGPGDVVFDECTLNWKGYSEKEQSGYLTAPQTTATEKGYLFRNCSVTADPKMKVVAGYWGRPWGGANAAATFLNTKLEKTNLITGEGWTSMSVSGVQQKPENAKFHEFGTTTLDGAAVDTSKRVEGTVMTEAEAAAVKAEDYFGSWVPYYYGIETRTVTFQVGAGASVTDLAVDSKAAALNAKNQLLALKEAVVTFKIGMDDGYTLTDVTGATWANDIYTVTADTVVISTRSNSSSGGSSSNVPSTGGSKTQTTTNSDGSKTTTKTDRKGNVTVTTKAPDGSQVVAYTSKDGDKSITVTDAKGTVQAKVELPATIPAPAEKFADVPAGHWAEESINRMAGLGTIQGIGGGNYDMDSPITRGSVATILYRLSNVEVDAAKGTFADVEAGDWYAEAVAWASGTGVVTGYSESVFAPKDSIDRQQLAVMLYRFAKLLRVDTATEADLTQFQDSAAVADWATEAMSWCVGKGILKGNGYGSLIPGGTASRAECATMLDRFIGLL